ncbi:hypothetical protein AB1Y20_014841 [Prymnesium parvum]|uniref:SHOCT domain-containing protein n=1 Tax=Prymnesium parvum TaxID=97485 RepID=A0AB34JZ18_PRYPA
MGCANSTPAELEPPPPNAAGTSSGEPQLSALLGGTSLGAPQAMSNEQMLAAQQQLLAMMANNPHMTAADQQRFAMMANNPKVLAAQQQMLAMMANNPQVIAQQQQLQAMMASDPRLQAMRANEPELDAMMQAVASASQPPATVVGEVVSVEGAPVGQADPAEALLQLHRMLEAGAISQAEYDQKKAEVLERI